jgi:DNA-binding FadR family transcriptional regulator
MQRSDQSGSSSSGRRYLAVAQDLLAAIAQGRHAIGDRLPSDREIAAQGGVSRATAREALLALELVGVVEVRHGDGTYVLGRAGATVAGSALDVPPRELIETRLHLEPVVSGLAAQRITPDALAALRRDLDEATELVAEPGQLPRFMELGLRFHADLAPCCGNSLMAGIVGQLVNAETHPLWVLVNQQVVSSEDARRGQLAGHRAVFGAVADGDADRAERAMRAHLDELEAAIFLSAAPDVPAAGPTR